METDRVGAQRLPPGPMKSLRRTTFRFLCFCPPSRKGPANLLSACHDLTRTPLLSFCARRLCFARFPPLIDTIYVWALLLISIPVRSFASPSNTSALYRPVIHYITHTHSLGYRSFSCTHDLYIFIQHHWSIAQCI